MCEWPVARAIKIDAVAAALNEFGSGRALAQPIEMIRQKQFTRS